jgi:hypothetical protein
MNTITLKQPVRLKLQHYMNGLHIYSFLCHLNISKDRALKTSRVYEHVVHPLLYLKK